MKHYLVMMCDPEGMPRAWATAPTLTDAKRAARKHLNVYRGEKAQTRDPLAHAGYTEVVEVVED